MIFKVESYKIPLTSHIFQDCILFEYNQLSLYVKKNAG